MRISPVSTGAPTASSDSRAPGPSLVVAATEAALDRERLFVFSGVLIVVVACWSWIGAMGADMYGRMTGPSRWMMTPRWDGTHIALLFAMWTAMMIGMMVPSAAPTLLLYSRVARADARGGRFAPRFYSFAAGYVAVWTMF